MIHRPGGGLNALHNGHGRWHPRPGPRSLVSTVFCVVMLTISGVQFFISTRSIQQQNAVRQEELSQYHPPPPKKVKQRIDVIDSLDASIPSEISMEEKEEEEEEDYPLMFIEGGVPPLAAVDKNSHDQYLRRDLPRVVQWLDEDDRWEPSYVATAATPLDITDGKETIPTTVLYQELEQEEEADLVNPIKEAMVRKFLDECVPMASWQTLAFPTCNALHEMDIATTSRPEEAAILNGSFQNDFEISLLSDQGSWRSVWKVQRDFGWSRSTAAASDSTETLVLKLLKFQRRDFNAESYEHHRVDALAMERLTASPHIVNLYAYCGQSVVTEYAATTARLLTKNTSLTSLDRLKMGRDIVHAMMDLHSMDYPNATNITFTHNDLNMANAVAVQGHIKLNDFNIGVLQRWNRTAGSICKMPVLFEAPLWKSPEEIVAAQRIHEAAEEEAAAGDTPQEEYATALNTEHWVYAGPTDVFGLGNLLFQVLTKRQPWTHLEPDGAKNASDAGQRKVRGEQPFVPPKYHRNTTTHVALAALHQAVQLCYRTNPADRPTSFQLLTQLNTAIAWIEERGGKINPHELDELFGGPLENAVD